MLTNKIIYVIVLGANFDVMICQYETAGKYDLV